MNRKARKKLAVAVVAAVVMVVVAVEVEVVVVVILCKQNVGCPGEQRGQGLSTNHDILSNVKFCNFSSFSPPLPPLFPQSPPALMLKPLCPSFGRVHRYISNSSLCLFCPGYTAECLCTLLTCIRHAGMDIGYLGK